MRHVLLFLIRIYWWTLSPIIGRVCRFQPSCSRYTATCIERFGALAARISSACSSVTIPTSRRYITSRALWLIGTRDEVADAHALSIEGRLNGEVMQSSNTAKMIFKIPYLISYISQGITLEPGDVIATGTPEGVGIFRTPPVLLKDGDTFEVTIEGLGTLRNTFAAPRE